MDECYLIGAIAYRPGLFKATSYLSTHSQDLEKSLCLTMNRYGNWTMLLRGGQAKDAAQNAPSKKGIVSGKVLRQSPENFIDIGNSLNLPIGVITKVKSID